MTDCQHLDFVARVDVHRLYEHDYGEGPLDPATLPSPDGYLAEVHVECAQCHEPFVFFAEGLPVGVVRERPTISMDATELRCPVRPQSSDPTLGLGLAGVRARLEMGSDHRGN